MKSRWVRIPLKIFLIWLVVTLYFYFQNPVIYRYTGFNAIIPIGEDLLVIDEISFHNYDQDKTSFYNEKVPWKYQLIWKLPPSMQSSYLYKILSFYSKPPLLQEYGVMQTCGTYISSKPINDTLVDSMHERYDISIYPNTGTFSQRSTREFYKNALVINSQIKFPFQEMNKPFIITVSDKLANKSMQFVVTPQWKKERLLDRGAEEKLIKSAEDFISNIYENETRQNVENIVVDQIENVEFKPSLAGKTIQMEGNLKWLDVYEVYYGVYQVDAKISEFKENDQKDSNPPDQITVYLHKNENGNYEMIDYTPNRIR